MGGQVGLEVVRATERLITLVANKGFIHHWLDGNLVIGRPGRGEMSGCRLRFIVQQRRDRGGGCAACCSFACLGRAVLVLHRHGYKYDLMWRFLLREGKRKEKRGQKGSFFFIRKSLGGERGERRETGWWIFIVGRGFATCSFYSLVLWT